MKRSSTSTPIFWTVIGHRDWRKFLEFSVSVLKSLCKLVHLSRKQKIYLSGKRIGANGVQPIKSNTKSLSQNLVLTFVRINSDFCLHIQKVTVLRTYVVVILGARQYDHLHMVWNNSCSSWGGLFCMHYSRTAFYSGFPPWFYVWTQSRLQACVFTACVKSDSLPVKRI